MLAIAETLVTAFCKTLDFSGDTRKPSVDVFDLAERVGAEAVVVRELPEDGRVEDSPYSTKIFLAGLPAKERRRFTLSHELGHLVLSDPKVFRLLRSSLHTDKLDVETLCDAFAAELLMPRKWVSRQYEDEPERLDVLYDVAERAEVSLAASAVRLKNVLGWQSSLLYFHRRRDWAPTIVAGRIPGHHIELSGKTASTLWALETTGEAPAARRTIELAVRGRQLRLRCEVRPTPSGVMCLAPLAAAYHGQHRQQG